MSFPARGDVIAEATRAAPGDGVASDGVNG